MGDDAIMGLHAFGSDGLMPDLTIMIEAPQDIVSTRRRHATATIATRSVAEPCPITPPSTRRFAISRPATPRASPSSMVPDRSRTCTAASFPKSHGGREVRVTLLGHDQPWREWRKAMGGERMHHAWPLAGRRGVGKGSFALAAARELIGTAPGEGGSHPDIITLTYGPKDDKEERKRADGKPYEQARSIRIAQIRAMQARLGTRPTLGDKRAIIIDPADDLERNAANALLKSLEEPGRDLLPARCAQPRTASPDDPARCRVLRFRRDRRCRDGSAIARVCAWRGRSRRAAAIAAAAGSPGPRCSSSSSNWAKSRGQ